MALAMIRHFAVLCLSLGSLRFAAACTTFAIGRKATADGSVIVSQSEDGDDLADPRLIFVPAQDHPAGAKKPVYYADGPAPRWVSNDLGPGYKPNEFAGPDVTEPIGYVPQVTHTFAYWDANYAVINEHNVGIGESTCSAVFYTCAKGDTRHCEPGRTNGEAILDSRMLTMLALERATSARQAIEIMGSLAYEYGFYGTHDSNGDGESLMVGDAQEAWVFHILADPTGTKAIWAARRVPDDGVTVVANMFTIRDVDVTDTENCLASPNIYSVAESHGWWKPGETLDFTKVYSNGEYDSKYYSGRRMWRGLSLAAPSLALPPEYSDIRYDRAWPWAVQPDKPITRQDVFSWYRDWYAGTKFDMTKGLAAGFAGTPDRFDTADTPGSGQTVRFGYDVPNAEGAWTKGAWTRTIALYRTNMVKVVQLRAATPELPREVAGVAWVAPGPAHYSPFLPVPSGLSIPLKPLAEVTPRRFTKDAFNWQARKVMMTAQIRFDHMHPLVEAKQKEIEDAAEVAISSASEELLHGCTKWGPWAKKLVTHTKDALESWQQLSEDMFIRFADNSDIRRISTKPAGGIAGGATENIASLSYPTWWLDRVGFTPKLTIEGPPPPPAETQSGPPAYPGSVLLLGTAEARHGFLLGVLFGGVVPGSALLGFWFLRRRSSPHYAKESTPYSLL